MIYNKKCDGNCSECPNHETESCEHGSDNK